MLTSRLDRIVSYVNSDVCADIGTDHAYASVEIIRQERAKKVIASDVREGPLKAAEGNIKRHRMESVIETRLGGGLSVLRPNEADTAVIAGMGGEMIIKIISEDMDIARNLTLILQPMNAQYELRKFLISEGFTIEHEDIETEGHRVYNILIVKNGTMMPFKSEIEYHLPKYLSDNPKFDALYDKKHREFKKIINGLRLSSDTDCEKLHYYEEMLRQMEAMTV